MSSPEISEIDLHRLVRMGAEDYASSRPISEKKLGVALWRIIDLEHRDTTRPQYPSEGDYCSFSFMQSRKAQVGPNVSADVMLKADTKFLDCEKKDWLLHVNGAALQLYVFLDDLPHDQGPMERSELLIAPKRRVYNDRPDTYRDTPHALVVEVPRPTPLPVPDIDNTVLILNKIAREY